MFFIAGIPFNDTSDFRLEILEYGQSILGDNLLGFQAGNEPDLYAEYVHPSCEFLLTLLIPSLPVTAIVTRVMTPRLTPTV